MQIKNEAAFWDRCHATNFFILIISHSGGIPDTGGRPIIEEWLSGQWGPEPLLSTRFFLYCGEQDQEGIVCNKMENARDVIEQTGGEVLEFIRDPAKGHGGFNHTPAYQRAAAETWFEQEPVGGSLDVELSLSDANFTEGDTFILDMNAWPHGWSGTAEFYVILDVMGEYWYHPGWTQEPDCEAINIAGPPESRIILEFTWPENAGEASGIYFWAGAVNQVTGDVLGEIDSVCFNYR